MERITPWLTSPTNSKQVFVIGTNEAGRHGAGAALVAKLNWGLDYGRAFGICNQSFGIPTKDKDLKVLDLSRIEFYVGGFIDFVQNNPEKEYYVTEVGCGLAGYFVHDIAPFFYDLKDFDNVWLPRKFRLYYRATS